MSVPRFGQVSALQSLMLALAGIECVKDFPTNDDRVHAMKSARKRLTSITKMDFGFDLAAWHEYLQDDPVFAEDYTFPRAWSGVKKEIEMQIVNPERLNLAIDAGK